MHYRRISAETTFTSIDLRCSSQLEVLDQSVATTVHLTNISSAFFPSSLTRAPVCELDDTLPAGEGDLDSVESEPGSTENGSTSQSAYELREGEMTIKDELENEDPVSQHRLRWADNDSRMLIDQPHIGMLLSLLLI